MMKIKKQKTQKTKKDKSNESDNKLSKYASIIKVILELIALYPTNEKLVDTFMIFLLAELDFFTTKSILTIPQFSLTLSMSFRETQCHCDFMVDRRNKKKKNKRFIVRNSGG